MEAIELGQYLKEVRMRRGLSIRQLAADAEVDFSWLSKVERGVYIAPAPHYLHRLADVLGVATDELFARAGYGTSHELPGFAPYLRAKYDLSDEAIARLAAEFDRVNRRDSRQRGQS